MAYADQQMSSRKVVALVLVAALHALVGYAFITGLAFNVIKKVAIDTKIVDVQEPPPPPEQKPPPPPPEQKVEPPPIVAPPPIVQTQTIAPPIVAPPAPPISPPAPVITPQAPVAPPAPKISQAAGAKGDPAQWITNDDYPPGAMREGREGVSRISWTVNEQGKVENCQVTQSSGTPELDETACRLVTRRGKYSPAKDQNGNPIRSTQSRAVRWQIPKE